MGIMKQPNDSVVDSRDFARIAKSIHYIATHFREQPRLATVADQAGLSEFHFNRLFRRWAGVTPKQYLAYVTGREAHGEIVNQSSVLDTAYAVGLSGPGRLHDLIVTLDAVTPGELKALGRGIAIDRDIDGGNAVRCSGLPHHAGPIAGVVSGIGDEREGLVAVEIGIGIDRGEVDLVLSLREVVDRIELVDAVDQDVLRLFDGGVLEDVGAFVADEEIPAEPARQCVVSDAADHPIIAELAEQHIVAGVALQVVISRIDVVAIATHEIVAVATLDDVIATAASQRIITSGAEDLIAAITAIDIVRIGVAAERIGEVGEIEPFDRAEDVALRIAGPGR